MIKPIDPSHYWNELYSLNQLINTDEDKERLRIDISHEKSAVIGAFTGQDLIGFGAVSFPYWDRIAMTTHLVVAESHRGKGFGTHIIESLISITSRAGMKRITIRTATWNTQAIQFYQRLGFVQCTVFPDYLGENNDMVWLDKRL